MAIRKCDMCDMCGVERSPGVILITKVTNNKVKCTQCLKVAQLSLKFNADVFKKSGAASIDVAGKAASPAVRADLAPNDFLGRVNNSIRIVIPAGVDDFQKVYNSLCDSFVIRASIISGTQIANINFMLIEIFFIFKIAIESINEMTTGSVSVMDLDPSGLEKNRFDMIIMEPVINKTREALASLAEAMSEPIPQYRLEVMNRSLIGIASSIDNAVIKAKKYISTHIEV